MGASLGMSKIFTVVPVPLMEVTEVAPTITDGAQVEVSLTQPIDVRNNSEVTQYTFKLQLFG